MPSGVDVLGIAPGTMGPRGCSDASSALSAILLLKESNRKDLRADFKRILP